MTGATDGPTMKHALVTISHDRTDSCDGVYDSYDDALAAVNSICATYGWRYNLAAGVMLGDPFAEPRNTPDPALDCQQAPGEQWADIDVAMYFRITPETAG
ncbi:MULTISPECIES: hypothetical protein [Mycolicibacter]|nr:MULTISPECIES: hypothetical protein [Mycolicibacter]RAV04289.1 hypothetical protein DQP56_00275 [Mycolicibacter senuensis]